MASSEVAVANQALSKFGGGQIATFDDATALARAVKMTYWRVIPALLTVCDWSFTRATVPLAPLAAPLMADNYLTAGWRFAYQLPPFGPGGILAAPFGYLATPNRAGDRVHDFELQAGVVYCNEPTLYADVVQAIAPAFWPPYFERAAVDSLAYELVMPVSGNSGLRDSLKEEAIGPPEENGRGGSLYLAMLADSRNDSSDTLGDRSPLVDARWI
jgi:hypothetical protein